VWCGAGSPVPHRPGAEMPLPKFKKHGYTAYKRGLCRCGVCRKANTAYEAGRRRRTNREKKPLPFMSIQNDTLTLEEYKRYRNT